MFDAKYDRQIRLWGVKSQERLEKAHILVLGSSTVLCETLKNLVLPGIGRYTIVDDTKVDKSMINSNFFLSQNSLDKNRVHEVHKHLTALNPNVKGNIIVMSPRQYVDICSVKSYSLVISTQLSYEYDVILSDKCYESSIPLLLVNSQGQYGWVRTVLRESPVIDKDSHSHRFDFRLSSPFPELLEFSNATYEQCLQAKTLFKVPYQILLIKALEQYTQQQVNSTPVDTPLLPLYPVNNDSPSTINDPPSNEPLHEKQNREGEIFSFQEEEAFSIGTAKGEFILPKTPSEQAIFRSILLSLVEGNSNLDNYKEAESNIYAAFSEFEICPAFLSCLSHDQDRLHNLVHLQMSFLSFQKKYQEKLTDDFSLPDAEIEWNKEDIAEEAVSSEFDKKEESVMTEDHSEMNAEGEYSQSKAEKILSGLNSPLLRQTSITPLRFQLPEPGSPSAREVEKEVEFARERSRDYFDYLFNFWISVAAIKTFYTTTNHLPVSSLPLPDFNTSSSIYSAMSRLYEAKAEKDYEEVRAHAELLMTELHQEFAAKDVDVEEIKLDYQFLKEFCAQANKAYLAHSHPLPRCLTNDYRLYWEEIRTELLSSTPSSPSPVASYLLTMLLKFLMNSLISNNFIKIFQNKSSISDEHSILADTTKLLLDELKYQLEVMDEDCVEGTPSLWKSEKVWKQLENVATELVRSGGDEFFPISSIIGGVAAQEVIKIISHQFLPMEGLWIYDGVTSDSLYIPILKSDV